MEMGMNGERERERGGRGTGTGTGKQQQLAEPDAVELNPYVLPFLENLKVRHANTKYQQLLRT